MELPQSVEVNDVNAEAVAPRVFCLTGFVQARKTVREERVRTCNKEPKLPAEMKPDSKNVDVDGCLKPAAAPQPVVITNNAAA